MIERHGDSLVIIAFEGRDPADPAGFPGERIPFTPPFGVAFAAWESDDGQRAWIERTATAGSELAENLARH